MVLSEAGFGTSLSWRQDEKPKAGHKLTFTQTLQSHAESEGRIIRSVGIPQFLGWFSKRVHFSYLCEHELKVGAGIMS